MTTHALKFLFDKVRDRFDDRVFPDFAPKGTPNPCMVYQLIGDEFESTMEAGRGDDGLLIQLRIYTDASTGGRDGANALRDSIRDELDALLTQELSPGVMLEHSMVDGYADTYEHETEEFGAICLWHPLIIRREPAFA